MTASYKSLAVAIVVVAMLVGAAWADSDYGFPMPATGWPLPDQPIILDNGGPDGGGYYYRDSPDTTYNAPVYRWQEISGIGVDMNITSDDQNVGPFLIGFTFNFYGIDFLTFRACSNGFASFTSTATVYINTAIPNAVEPNNLLAAYWDDLYPGTGAHAYYYTNNTDTLIIEWNNFAHLDNSGFATFEIILTSDGNILYQYNSMTGTNNSHTIGIENQAGTIGLQYVYNTARDETGTAILFTHTAPDFGAHDIVVVASDLIGDFAGLIDAYPDIDTVTYFDARTATPTLSYLQGFDAAVVYSNYVFSSPAGMGNVLADYLDAGGAVILLQGCFATGFALQGRAMTAYSPLTVGSLATQVKSLGQRDAGHPVMVGIDTLTEFYSSVVTTQHSAYLVASYTDGTPMVAYNPVNNLVGINCFVGQNHQYTGELIDMIHRAINFAIEGPTPILFAIADGPYSPETARRLKQFSDIPGVHLYDARYATPTLAYLNLYQSVLVWSNNRFNNSQLLGNRLADYADLNGGVVLLEFSFANGYALQGRIMSSYSPFDSAAYHGQTRTLGVYDPNHFLMNGVTNVTGYFYSDVTLRSGDISVASWDNSTPFVAYHPADSVVAINAYIGGPGYYGGDMITLVHNAINFSRGHVTGINEPAELPARFELTQNYPNPFNPTTIIAFDLPSKSDVTLEIFNVLGQRVTSLPQGSLNAGHHVVTFNARELSSGVYFYRLNAGDHVKARKMIVLK